MNRRLALIIGNSEYDDPTLARLVTPAGDTTDLSAVLSDRKIGHFDQVETLLNQPLTTVRRAVAHFFARRKPDDLLLLYFSGHGVLDDRGRLFLAVKDTEHAVLRGTALAANFITDEMDSSRSKRQVLVLDCCHSGAFARGAKNALGASVGTAAAFEGNGYGRVVLTATDSTQYAWEGSQITGEGLNSIFTRHLIHGLRSGEADLDQDGLVTLDEWYDYAYDQVVAQTSKQTPRKWSFNEQGEMIIAHNPHWQPLQLPLELQQALQSPSKHVRLGAVKELDSLMRREKGLNLVAKIALERLKDDNYPAVSHTVAEILARQVQQSPSKPAQKVKMQTQPEPRQLETDPPANTKAEKKVEPEPPSHSTSGPAKSRQLSKRRAPDSRLISGFIIAVVALILMGTVIGYPFPSRGEPSAGVITTDEPNGGTHVDDSSPVSPVVTPLTPMSTAQATSISLPQAITDTNDSPMVLIPAGPFEMGANADVVLAECQKLYIGSEDRCQRSWYEDEEPPHMVTLDAFYIDQYEVTNDQFATFLNEQGNQTENGFTWLDADDQDVRIRQNESVWQVDDNFADHPVTEVTWHGAQAYCDWRSARLPTEAEWEKAARGPEGQLYPWGNTFNGNLTNFCDSNCTFDLANSGYDDGYATTAPVGSYPAGISPYGVYDMAGNVWEWVADWYASDYYAISPEFNPTGPTSGSERIVRGGGWNSYGHSVHTTDRNWVIPVESFYNIGFRCVRSP